MVVLLTAFAPCVPTPASATQSIDEVVEAELRRAGIPGAIVGIVARDSVIFLKAYGVVQLHGDEPLAEDAVFRAGGVMELVNGLVAARLAVAGRVDLDAPIGTYVPDVPRRLHGATLAQLLSHTAGVTAVPAVPGRGGDDDLGAAARQLTDLDAFTEPGSIYSRSEPGLMLAAHAIERAAGRPYVHVIHETILAPLAMNHSTVEFERASSMRPTPGHAVSESAESPIEVVAPSPDSTLHIPLRGLFSSAADLSQLLAALLNDGAVGSETRLPAGLVEQLLQPRALVGARPGVRAGLGVRVTEWQDLREIRIGGSGDGHALSLRALPDVKVGVVVLANRSSGISSSISDFVFRRLLGMAEATPIAERVESEPPNLDVLRATPGKYVNGGEVLEVLVEADAVRLRSGDLVLDVQALDGGIFGAVLPDGRVALRFQLIRDTVDRPYLWIGQRALAHDGTEK